MKYMARWSLVLVAAWSLACISIPIPDRGPELEEIELPSVGDEASSVRRTFGEPQRLDIPPAWVYEWTTDRRFVVVPVIPLGMPAGAVVAGNRYRMLVRFDSNGRVQQISCTEREVSTEQAPDLGCELPIGPLRARARQLFAYRLDSRPGFEKLSFNQSEGTGASTPMALSADGRLLAATDAKNRLWVLDTETGESVHRHDGQPIRFFSLAPAGQVKAAFAKDGRRLVIAQHKVGVEILDRAPDGMFTTTASLPDGGIGQVSVGGDQRVVFGFGEQGISMLQSDGSWTAPIDPAARLDFHASGPEPVEPPGPRTDLTAVRFGQSWWTGGRSAVFAADGRGVAVLDLRNDYARVGKQGYAFAPDGRWLAHNTGRHFELWPSEDVYRIVEDRLVVDQVAPAWVALMPFTNRGDEEPTAHLPVAFRSDGGLVAAASRAAIHVWRTDDGAPVALIGALRFGYDHSSGATTIEEADPDNSLALRVLALALAPDNRLTAVFCDGYFKIVIGAWQIEE